MKIENVKFNKIEYVKRFIKEHPDEVFTTSELREKLGFDPKSMLLSLKRKDEIDFLSLGKQNTYYGFQNAIENLKQRVEKEWKSMK